MNTKEEFYCLGTLEDRNHLRFAYEFIYWQPIEMQWQQYYLQRFIGMGGEKKQLPCSLTIKSIEGNDRTEEILVLEFIYLTAMPIEFREHYNNWVLFVLVELSSKERVIIPCCWSKHLLWIGRYLFLFFFFFFYYQSVFIFFI